MKIYTLASLPYSYDALEPYIDARTMEIHHTKHQQKYIDELNKALTNHIELQQKPLVELLRHLSNVPDDIRESVRNNGGGELNHSMFWPMMKKNAEGKPVGILSEEIKKQFGTFEQFKEQFSKAAEKRFGSGWAWLCLNKQGNLEITSTANQDTPFSEHLMPVLGLDVWEHAYYLKYQNKRVDYIQAWWHVVNWEYIEENYRTVR